MPTARTEEAERATLDDAVRAMPADTDWDALVTIATGITTGTAAGKLRTAVAALAAPQT